MSVSLKQTEDTQAQKAIQKDIESKGLKELFSELKKDGLTDEKLPEVYELVKNIKSINPDKGIYLLLGQIRETKINNPQLDFAPALQQILEQEKVEVKSQKKRSEAIEKAFLAIAPRQPSSLLERINEAREKREEARKQREAEEAKLDPVGSLLRKRSDIEQEKQRTEKIDDKMSKEEMADLVLDSFIYHAFNKNFDYEEFKKNLGTEDKEWFKKTITWIIGGFTEKDLNNPKKAVEIALAEFSNNEEAPKYLISLANQFIISKIDTEELIDDLSRQPKIEAGKDRLVPKRKSDELDEPSLPDNKKRKIGEEGELRTDAIIDTSSTKKIKLDEDNLPADKRIRTEEVTSTIQLDTSNSLKRAHEDEKQLESKKIHLEPRDIEEKINSITPEITPDKEKLIKDNQEWFKKTSQNWKKHIEEKGEAALGKKWKEEVIKQESSIQGR